MQHLDNSIFLSSCGHFTVDSSHNRGSNFLKTKKKNPQIFLATECIAFIEIGNAFEVCLSPCVKSFYLLVYLISYGYHSVEQNLVLVKGKKKKKPTPKPRSLLPMGSR